MSELDHKEYRIPKLSVPVVCQTDQGEVISGEIFLDVLSVEYSTAQILEFFNSNSRFVPIRTSSASRPILLQKDSIVKAEVVGLLTRFEEEASGTLAERKKAILYMKSLDPITAEVILDMPEEHSRLLDLLNLRNIFFSAIVDTSYILVNSHYLYKVEEL